LLGLPPYDVQIRTLLPDDSSARGARSRRDATLRGAIRDVSAWILLLALSIDALALVLEPLYLLHSGAPLRAGIADAFASVGLSIFFSIVVAVPVAIVHATAQGLGHLRRPFKYAWPAPLFVLAWGAVSCLVSHRVIHAYSILAGQLILAALLAASLLLATAVANIESPRLRTALGVGFSAAAFLVSLRLPGVLTNEPRDLLWFAGVASFAAIFDPLRRRAKTLHHEKVSRALGALLAGSTAILLLPHVTMPGWRSYTGGHFAPRLARFSRMFVDLDGDGFSPVAWGTDCDDADVRRQPAMPERDDGGDWNCNGKHRSSAPTPAMRGLGPSVGEAELPPGAIDRVVFVTIDCFRYDAFRPDVMPNLTRLASRGLRLERLYAGGSRTALSLPFALRSTVRAPSIAETLGQEHVSTTALFGYRHSTLEGNVSEGFETFKRPVLVDHRIRAPELTDLALADLSDPSHAHQHFLWVHYFDAHGPRTRRVLPGDVPVFPPIAGELDADSALYLSELYFVDRQMGRLFDAVEALDPGLKRTLLIVSSDHGEGFGRHDVFEHGVSTYESIVHVPGVVVGPPFQPGSYAHVLSERDVPPTVLGAFGLLGKHPDIEAFGRSWLRLPAAEQAPLHDFVVVYSTTTPFERWSEAPLAAIVDDRAKLTVDYMDGVTHFFRLDRDPGEDHEASAESLEEVAEYRDRLETFRDLDTPLP
jgi:hypothetical protein